MNDSLQVVAGQSKIVEEKESLESSKSFQNREIPVITNQKPQSQNRLPHPKLVNTGRTRFKPGQVTNPGGKPSDKELRKLLLDDFNKHKYARIKKLHSTRIDLYFAYIAGKPRDVLEIVDGQPTPWETLSLGQIAQALKEAEKEFQQN